jgi:hypothetical protein
MAITCAGLYPPDEVVVTEKLKVPGVWLINTPVANKNSIKNIPVFLFKDLFIG